MSEQENLQRFREYLDNEKYREAYDIFIQDREKIVSTLSDDEILSAFTSFFNLGMRTEAENFYKAVQRFSKDKRYLELTDLLFEVAGRKSIAHHHQSPPLDYFVNKLTSKNLENSYGRKAEIVGLYEERAKQALSTIKEYVDVARKEGVSSFDAEFLLQTNDTHAKVSKSFLGLLRNKDQDAVKKVLEQTGTYIDMIYKYGIDSDKTRDFLIYSLGEDKELQSTLFSAFNIFRVSKLFTDSKLEDLATSFKNPEEGKFNLTEEEKLDYILRTGESIEDFEDRGETYALILTGKITHEEALERIGITQEEYERKARKAEILCNYINIVNSGKTSEAVKFKEALPEEDRKPLEDFDVLNEIIFREKRSKKDNVEE